MGVLSPKGLFCFTKAGLALVFSVFLTWWIASLVPQYTPIAQAEVSSRIQEARKKFPNVRLDWATDDDLHAPYNSSKMALMIESRPIPHLVPQILHMISVVPPDWRFMFIGSQQSVFSVGRAHAIKHQQAIGKMDLMQLPEPWGLESKEHIYRMLTDMRFYDEFLPGVEWMLKYESDSILCANSETSLDEWLDWSWAGAPRDENDLFSGNGGLSLRRVSVISRILNFQVRHNDTEPEDEWFGKRLRALPGVKVASKLDGALSVEDFFIEKPMGYHARGGGERVNFQVWSDPVARREILEYCPELSMIIDMKLERERCPDDPGDGFIDKKEDAVAKPVDIEGPVLIGGPVLVGGPVGGTAILFPPQPPPFPKALPNKGRPVAVR